jgi:hypothetical protein
MAVVVVLGLVVGLVVLVRAMRPGSGVRLRFPLLVLEAWRAPPRAAPPGSESGEGGHQVEGVTSELAGPRAGGSASRGAREASPRRVSRRVGGCDSG